MYLLYSLAEQETMDAIKRLAQAIENEENSLTIELDYSDIDYILNELARM